VELPYGSSDEVTRAFAEHVSPGKVAAFEALGIDVVMGKREGAYFWDAYTDRRFMNCHSNGGVFNLGHRNPDVLAALQRALGDLDVGNHHLVSGWRARLAERLAATTDGRMPGVVFAASGSEAVDGSIKLAHAVTGRRGVVSMLGAYHGNTGLAMAASDARYRDPFHGALEGYAQVPFDDVAAVDAAVGDDTAVVLLEPIPATLGMPVPSPGYLAEVQAICRDRGALFALDEAQTGLGRSGRIWCHQHDDLSPDLLVTGKGLSGGVFPMAATLVTRPALDVIEREPFAHVSSFGGAELGCVVTLAVLDAIEAPGFLQRVEDVGARFEKAFHDLAFEVQGRGLMLGLKWPNEGDGVLAAKACFDAGVFCVFANNDTSALQFLPPLVLSDAQVDEMIGLVVGALS
jgi:acetylornithine/succinyldiaminopimelate/putrescine aminotransferase